MAWLRQNIQIQKFTNFIPIEHCHEHEVCPKIVQSDIVHVLEESLHMSAHTVYFTGVLVVCLKRT